MRSLTVEYQRFGDPTGIIRLSDRYIRTIGATAPAEEVGFGIPQENLAEGMSALAYSKFESAPDDLEGIRRTAELFIADMGPHLLRFLDTSESKLRGDGLLQIDVVTRALELAQLPFEILEETHPSLVVTRRIRQPWPPPAVVRSNAPHVLFAWAEPKRRAGSSRRMNVPHGRHRELLADLLADWGGSESAVVEVENATRAKLSEVLAAGHRFTHVHLLAHGIGPDSRRVGPGDQIDLVRKPDPTTLLALEEDDGTIDRVPPDVLARIFSAAPLPETFAIATCHSAEVDPVRSGGTLAHVLHQAGVPVVLASQLALTQDGSDELIRTFFGRVIEGEDPRRALRACRDALREGAQKTYYDRVALVGYVHVDGDLDERLRERRFGVALTHLKAASRDAARRVARAVVDLSKAKVLTEEQRAEAEGIRLRFASVREKLAEMEPDRSLTAAQREELRGLQASSLKREAEAAWELSRVLTGDDAREWTEHSRLILGEATEAYCRAARTSRDHHWSSVQWLVLEAVQRGTLAGFEDDWLAAEVAARDAVAREPRDEADETECAELAEGALWGWGSLCELNLLAELIDREAGRDGRTAGERARACLDEFLSACPQDDDFPISSIEAQLGRYMAWWSSADWKLPPPVAALARELHDHLKTTQA